jgi:hypothetical protein
MDKVAVRYRSRNLSLFVILKIQFVLVTPTLIEFLSVAHLINTTLIKLKPHGLTLQESPVEHGNNAPGVDMVWRMFAK